MYAHRARKMSASDREVDGFTARALADTVSEEAMGIDGLEHLIVRALAIRAKAKHLYENTGDLQNTPVEPLSGPATMVFFADPKTIPAQARGLGARRLSGERTREDYYWEVACIEKLGILGRMVTLQASDTEERKGYDIYGLLHSGLNHLSRDLCALEMIALYDKLEHEGLRFAGSFAAGGTWVDIPDSCREMVSALRKQYRKDDEKAAVK